MQNISSDSQICLPSGASLLRACRHMSLVATLAGSLAGSAVLAQSVEVLTEQHLQYDAVTAKTILELQPFRSEVSAVMEDTDRAIRLTSLNPAVNAWFLLRIGDDGTRDLESYHLENPDPQNQQVTLDAGAAPALVISGRSGATRCQPWADAASSLEQARDTGLSYAPICDGRLYLRNDVPGSTTSLEKTTDFLRDHVWKGEEVVRFVRDSFFRDSHLETGQQIATGAVGQVDGAPLPAKLSAADNKRPVITALHGLGLSGTKPGQMTMGNWYPVAELAGVFASAILPKAISTDILKGPGKANNLDSVEGNATVYLVAFDLTRFDVGFAIGTDHPHLGWSSRPPASVRPRGMPGPDGVKSASPLETFGMVSPALTDRTIAAFTGGFKRQHGAFKYGDYRTLNYGTHYGFIQDGVILSKLQPNLSTFYGLTDGTIAMKTWQEADNALLPRIRFARQNGVPLVELDPETGLPVPGELVTQWGAGNWSGSAKAELRTLRAGACMLRAGKKSFLVYGYFSTATPSAMARTFQAYGCDYAMLLDMNALEHTYLALYVRHQGAIHIEHLIPGMAVIDKKTRDGTLIPRFLGFPDNRDLFYLTLRKGAK